MFTEKESTIMTPVQFSSFQIGRMLNVSRQAVNQWIDKGYIRSYRTPGGHRRVKREDLIGFLKTRNIPLPADLGGAEPTPGEVIFPSIMMLNEDPRYPGELYEALMGRLPAARVIRFNDGYDALVAIGASPPDLLVLDKTIPNIDGAEICRRLKENPLTQAVPIVLLATDDEECRGLKDLCAEEILSRQTPPAEVAARIEQLARAGMPRKDSDG